MKATGTKTAVSTSAMAMTGPETSFMACSVAAFGDMPCSMWCITASTTTMASSTTMPMASTRPSRESVFTEKPSSGKIMNVPMRATGTVSSGMSVARQFCRKTKTTRMTSSTASSSVLRISSMPAVMASVVSRVIWCFTPGGKRVAISSAVFFTAVETASAFEPGAW